MSLTYIIVLAVIQGLTEFLPVSSSAHLTLAPLFFGEKNQGLAFDVALHLGTLSAALVYYRKDVWEIALAVLQWNKASTKPMRNLGVYIVLATIPAVLGGLVIHHFYPDGIDNVKVITATTLFFGALMGVADWTGKKDYDIKDIKLRHAMVIGCAQVLSLIPGTSRSGSTMTAARFMGFKREDAARFSFLLGMPATFGAGLMGVVDMIRKHDVSQMHDAAIGAVLSFIVGIAAIHFMIRWLGKFGLMPYVVYRILLGGFLLVHFVL